MEQPGTAFVLAGGGSYGAVQVGMLRALFVAGITPDSVAPIICLNPMVCGGSWRHICRGSSPCQLCNSGDLSARVIGGRRLIDGAVLEAAVDLHKIAIVVE